MHSYDDDRCSHTPDYCALGKEMDITMIVGESPGSLQQLLRKQSGGWNLEKGPQNTLY